MSCIFCKIVAGEIPANIVFRDEHVIAFHDLHPQAPTHVLVIPRKHIATVNDLGEADIPIIGHQILAARQIAQDLGLAEEGYRLVMNTNEAGGQTVYHIHLHLLGGRNLDWPPG